MISQDNLSGKISFIIDLFESVGEENCSLVSCEKSVHCLLYNFQKRYILQQPISSWFLLKRKKIDSSWHYWHFQTPPVHPSHHSFNNEWNLGPRRNKDGGWNACLFKAWTLQWFHRLFSTWLKRLTIFWRIFRRLAYFHVWKCAASATGNKLTVQHKVCWPGRYVEGRLSSFPISKKHYRDNHSFN